MTDRTPPAGGDARPLGTGALVAGGLVALFALRKMGPLGLAAVAAGGAYLYHRMREGDGIAPGAAHKPSRWLRVHRSVTIARPRNEVFAYWRDPTHFPQFMSHVESVTAAGPDRHHWVVRGPAGTSFGWDAELYDIEQDRRIRWRTVPPADVRSEGTVVFDDAPDDGTEVHLTLTYEAPGGRLGAAIARLLGEEPDVQARDDLMALKRLLEGQPSTGAAGSPLG
ncbi:SRPBCC family protein [Caenispirillum bisanense]|uniref:Uncharacterized membrane protein n=1 Tax=Caenispirillum bisanense TaxID=414052 RepID=A0A286GQX3_9PROT|nr:SRPBCC family protein [Caenispirillum bisanense]SOD97933.1 Uncharacterized membrane protein [Caenispirillum bisanense]